MNAIQLLKNAIFARHCADDTFDQYAFWIRKFYSFLKIPVSQWSGDDVTRGMVWLRDCNYSATSRKNALCAVVFMFRWVLKRDLGLLDLPPMPKQRKTLRDVPTREEVARIIMLLTGQAKLIGGIIYGGGTRVEETCTLRIQDIDFHNHEIRIHQGKGDKSRLPPLPELMSPVLQHYIKVTRFDLFQRDLARGAGYVELPGRLAIKYPRANREYRWQFLFPSNCIRNEKGRSRKSESEPGYRWQITKEAVEQQFSAANRISGIIKRITPHTFRHAFTTHALENGEEFETVRKWLGHEDANTTLIYAHTQHRGTSPMDFGRVIKPISEPLRICFKN
jgi:site-specific recombinase XerD